MKVMGYLLLLIFINTLAAELGIATAYKDNKKIYKNALAFTALFISIIALIVRLIE